MEVLLIRNQLAFVLIPWYANNIILKKCIHWKFILFKWSWVNKWLTIKKFGNHKKTFFFLNTSSHFKSKYAVHYTRLFIKCNYIGQLVLLYSIPCILWALIFIETKYEILLYLSESTAINNKNTRWNLSTKCMFPPFY